MDHPIPTSLATEVPAFTRFHSRRSAVYSTKGMVSSSQPLACEAGLEILRAGGNAADAAIAVSTMLNVAEPTMCGVGGDGFCLYFDNKTKKITAINGCGRSPQALTLEVARKSGASGTSIPFTNINSATVPGCAGTWVDTFETLGSGNVSLEQIFAPAIKAAEEGVPISELTSRLWKEGYKYFHPASPNANEMLIVDANGETHAPCPGEIFKNPGLAQTFKEISKHGKKGFYEGRIAEAIIDLVQSKGGVMTLEDLKNHKSTFVTPITSSFGGPNGVTLHELGPNTQGIVAVIALEILQVLEEEQKINLKQLGHNSAQYLHVIIDVLRIAFADARKFVGDPDVVNVPVKELLSKEYIRERAKLFDHSKSLSSFPAGNPIASSDTVLFVTADVDGNACSFIQSNYAEFGTYAIPKGCGFTLQNRGSNFELREGHANGLQPNKRPYHTIIPALVTNTKDGELFMTYGVMGGFNQPQGHVQVLLNTLLFGFNPQEALDAPRICISPDTDDSGAVGTKVFVEEGIAQDTLDELKRLGHDVRHIKGHDRFVFGRGQIIRKLPNGVWAGGSDPRADGHSVPQL